MEIVAYVVLALNALSLVVMPFLIGRARKPLSPGDSVVLSVVHALTVAVAGRVAGLW